MSRTFNITVGNEEFIVNEVASVTVNRRRMTEVEVRKDCGDYYQQFRNGFVPRNADEQVIRQYIADFYAADDADRDDSYDGYDGYTAYPL